MQRFCHSKEISSFFFSTLALFEQLDWKENGVACQFPLLNVPLFFFQSCMSVEKKRIKGKCCFCVLCNISISASSIINPGTNYWKEKIVDNTHEEKNHLD